MEKKITKQKMQTLISMEEQHLAQMSSTTTTTTTTTASSSSSSSTTTSKKKKTISKKLATTAASATTTSAATTSAATAIEDPQQQSDMQEKVVVAAATTGLTKSSKIARSEKIIQQRLQQQQQQLQQKQELKQEEVAEIELQVDTSEQEELLLQQQQQQQEQQHDTVVKKEKTKKKQKKDKQLTHKSLKSSFSKFDALEKREQIQNGQSERQSSKDCRLCQKPVYKMEEIKAEKSIYHRNCFRCHECGKQLKVDNYQSHEGTLYCIVHLRLLFAPKCIEEESPERPRKPELIIRESQPIELPPDVARSSDKPDLGLAELQQLNLRSKFQVFESGQQQHHATEQQQHIKLTRNISLKTKLAKLQAHGLNTNGVKRDANGDDAADDDEEHASSENNEHEHDDDDDDNDDSDAALNIDCPKRERPIGLGHAMHDIKTRFERGPTVSKEERREERKQELQNIRSRLFMGKQARIKEMYQQAVAESEQGITSTGKHIDIEVGKETQRIKARFETGDIFANNNNNSDYSDNDDATDEQRSNHANATTPTSAKAIQNDAEVFESAISKQSRNIFMSLDANLNASERNCNQNIKRTPLSVSNNIRNNYSNMTQIDGTAKDVIKCDETNDDVTAGIPSTNDLSQKFKFFETYQPQTPQRKQFRITPPRDGVGKMPTPPDADAEDGVVAGDDDANEKHLIEKSQTTSRMLNKFRQIEQQGGSDALNGGAPTRKPLKCFTPPPDGGRRYYQNVDSDYDDDDEEEDDEEEEDDDDDENDRDGNEWQYQKTILNDAALEEAKALARTQQLRKKFEKWENEEKERERNENPLDVYSRDVSDDTNIESTKTIRQHFENLKNAQPNPTSKVRYQVNRFV